MADPKLHRRVGTVLHYDPHMWEGQPLILRAEVARRTPRKVYVRHIYSDGGHTLGGWFLGQWDTQCHAALTYPNARIEVPNA